MNYSDRLKELRNDKEITQKEIADYLKMDKDSYGHYERQDYIIPIKHLNSVCNYLNVSIDYILGLSNTIEYPHSNNEIDRIKSGERLKKLRKDKKMTQAVLASHLKTVSTVIGGYEKGRRLIATPFLYMICKDFKISADYLLGKIDNPKYLK